MTAKNIGLKNVGLVLVNRKRVLVIIAGACFLSGCNLLRPTSPVLHKTNCDLSPVLKVSLPEHIDTLALIQRSKVIAENGINKSVGGRSPDDIKEFFYLNKGDAEYQFLVFFSDTAAIYWYESEKKREPVLKETTVNARDACLYYTQEPRADPEGGSVPMGYFIMQASFRLHNAFIRVTIRDDKPQSDKLTIAVEYLAQMLSVWTSTHQP